MCVHFICFSLKSDYLQLCREVSPAQHRQRMWTLWPPGAPYCTAHLQLVLGATASHQILRDSVADLRAESHSRFPYLRAHNGEGDTNTSLLFNAMIAPWTRTTTLMTLAHRENGNHKALLKALFFNSRVAQL